MTLIDANADKISEGDYLLMCNAMKDVHGNMKTKRVNVRTDDYYEFEMILSKVTAEITRLQAESDRLHYRRKLTRCMKIQAMRDLAIKEGVVDSVFEYTAAALHKAGVRVNFSKMYAQYVQDYNTEVFDNKKRLHEMIEDEREHRDQIVCLLADELNE